MSIASAFPASPAPWAEVVPGMGAMTVDALLSIPDDGYVYEVVDGILVRVAGSGGEQRRSRPTSWGNCTPTCVLAA